MLEDVEALYSEDPEGLHIAAKINQQLPPTVQVRIVSGCVCVTDGEREVHIKTSEMVVAAKMNQQLPPTVQVRIYE